jgi:hypothetical protein
MKTAIEEILPKRLVGYINEIKGVSKWRKRGYLNEAPQFVKEQLFLKYGVPNAPWVETGTFRGKTTLFLAKHSTKVYTIEPAKELYDNAVKMLAGRNVELFNDVSEAVFPNLMPTLSGDLNFWLDGHYSAGRTFKGDTDCPVEDELRAIENNVSNFGKVSILIDDVRCFLQVDPGYSDYPSIDYLVDWARKQGFSWSIEHDIFIMRNYS